MKKLIAVLALMVMLPVGVANAQTPTLASLQETIQTLIQQVEQLQQRLAEMRGEIATVRTEVREEIRLQLREGMSNEEVQKLQELLASDPDIYPEGLQTGYYGALTKGAVMRFQTRHELPATGEVDDATRELLNEYFGERGDGEIPPGLLRAPGIRDKVERRIASDCDDSRGMAFLCKRLKDKYDDDDDDMSEDDDELEIEVEIENGEAKVEIEYPDGTEEEFTVEETDEDAIIAAIVAATDLTTEEVEAVIEFDEEDEDDDDDDDDEDDEDEDDDDDDDDEDDEEQS